jgi:Protein of unknown function (DUF1549)/Protein of unknown function (DUF1553)
MYSASALSRGGLLMPNEPIIDELSPLLEALCEERLTPDEVVHLERLVLASPEARWRYLTYVDLHGSLYWNAAGIGSPTALSSEEIPVWAGAVVPVPEPVSIPSRRQHHWLLRQSRAFAALTILAFFGIGWFLNSVLSSKPGGGNLARNSAPSERVTTPNRNHPVSVEKNAPRLHGPPIDLVSKHPGPKTAPVTSPPPTATTPIPTVPAPPEPVRQELDSHEVVAAVNVDIRRGWAAADVRPSEVAEDAEWLRRVSLDLLGRIPTVDEAESFLANRRPNKRSETIDTLLDDTGFARNLTTVWTNLLVGRRTAEQVNRPALQKFLRMSFATNRPWNQIVYDLVAAEGNNSENGASNFLIAHLNNDALPATAVTARVFLGEQIQCNQCHNNPFDKSQQTVFWEMHSFFSQTAAVPRVEHDPRTGQERYAFTELVTRDAGGPIYFETQQGVMRVAYPRYNGYNVDPSPETNRRAALARLMTEGEQPELAAAFVNRLWGHLFGEAFTQVVDDIGPHSPASHPELLKLLTQQFIRSGYDVKQLTRWMCNSEAYQLTSRFGKGNQSDEPTEGQLPYFSRMYVKAMTPEQVYDSFVIATKAHRAGGVDWEQAESQRLKWLSQFVVDYGTDENDEAMRLDGNLVQALTLMNGKLIEKALEVSPGTVLDEVVRKKSDEKDKIRELCLAVLSRPPSGTELSAMRKLVREDATKLVSRGTDRSTAETDGYQDLFWALLNSNEFSVVH